MAITDTPAEFGPFSAILPVPLDVPTGWLCPYCKRVYGPVVRQCVICSPPSAPFTGPLPRPDPRKFPHLIGAPCQPSREGGMCGCDEPADPARLSFALPPEMASPYHQRIAKIGSGWREVFPGLQASMPGFDPCPEGAEAVVLFRLTPRDGEQHD